MRGRRKVKITKAGYSFMLISLGIGVAALNTGNNLLYLLFGMMLSFIIISGILSDTSMRRLAISRVSPKEVTANRPFPMKITVTNGKRWLPSFSLSVEDVGEHSGGSIGFIPKVPAGGHHNAYCHLTYPLRGWRKYHGFKVLTKYPFGLIQKTDYIKCEGEILVYPEIFDVDEVSSWSALFQGEYLSGEKGFGVNPWGPRDYRWGDDARLIHWKSTAKRGDWMIKEFESEKKLKVIVDLVLADPKLFPGKAYERMRKLADIEKLISMAASMVVCLSRSNYEIGLSINGTQVVGKGRGYITGYLKALALIDTENLGSSQKEHIAPTDASGEHILVTNVPGGGAGLTQEEYSVVINDRNWHNYAHLPDKQGRAQ